MQPLNQVELHPLASTQPLISPTTSRSLAKAADFSDTDGYFVGLAISGGGLRSANFGAACMFQLERIGLLQKVDYISSVSGGSLPAALYCLNHQNWNPEFVQQKLTHEFATDMLDRHVDAVESAGDGVHRSGSQRSAGQDASRIIFSLQTERNKLSRICCPTALGC